MHLKKDINVCDYTPRKDWATASNACGGHGKNQSITVLFISPERKVQLVKEKQK